MNLCSHPRPLTVLWHVRRFLVSSGQNCSATDLSSLRTMPLCDASKLSSDIKAADRTHYSHFMHSPDTFSPIQNT
jgi:hypothetical protein